MIVILPDSSQMPAAEFSEPLGLCGYTLDGSPE